MKFVGKFFLMVQKVFRWPIKNYYKSRFKKCGKKVYLGNNGIATYENISIGDNVYIGSNYVFQSVHGEIVIGNHVMFGPGVHIHGGNHEYSIVGKYMDEIEKHANDAKVVIEDDVWVGANAIILGGVCVGFGSVIGAGAVVTHDTIPGGIYAGNPAKLIKMRFEEDEMKLHKEQLRVKEL